MAPNSSTTADTRQLHVRALALTVLALAAAWAGLTLVARGNPLVRATRAAVATGTYTFTGASGSEYGAVDNQYLESGSGVAFGPITVTLGPAPAEPILVNWPNVQRADGAPVTRRLLAPAFAAGDPLGLVAVGHAARATGTEDVAGQSCRRIEFLASGGAYIAWWQAHPHVMPVNADAGGMPTFAARGVLWADPATGLPCRIYAELDLPRLAGEQTGTGWVDWTYRWRPPTS